METLFHFNSTASFSSTQVKDGIDLRLDKIHALLCCLMLPSGFSDELGVSTKTLFYTLDAIDGFLKEIELLCKQLFQCL